jgi:hypothetical protein
MWWWGDRHILWVLPKRPAPAGREPFPRSLEPA